MKTVSKFLVVICSMFFVNLASFSQEKDTLNIAGNLMLIKSENGDKLYNPGLYINKTTRYGNRTLYPKKEFKVKIDFKEKLTDELYVFKVSGQDNGLLLVEVSGSSIKVVGSGTYDKLVKGTNKFKKRYKYLFPIYTEKRGKQGLIIGASERLKPQYDKVEFEQNLEGHSSWLAFKILDDGYEKFYLYNYNNFGSFAGNTFEYYYLDKEHPNFVHISNNGRWGLGGLSKGKVLVNPNYDKVKVDKYEGLAYLIDKKKIGLSDLESGKVIFEPEYDNIDIYGINKPYHMITTKDGKYGYINVNSFTKNVIKPTYDKLFYFACNERIMFSENGKYGLLDKKGRVIVPANYDDIYPFPPGKKVPSSCSQSLFAVKKGNLFAPYSVRDGELDKFVYDTVISIKEYTIVLSGKNKTYSFNKDGKKKKVK